MSNLDAVMSMARQVTRLDRMVWLTEALRECGLSVIVVGDSPDNFLSVASQDRERIAAVMLDDESQVIVVHRRGVRDREVRQFGPYTPREAVDHLGKRLGATCAGPDAAERPPDGGGAS